MNSGEPSGEYVQDSYQSDLPTAAILELDKIPALTGDEKATGVIKTSAVIIPDRDRVEDGDELVRRKDAEYYAGRQFVRGEKRERQRILNKIEEKIEDIVETESMTDHEFSTAFYHAQERILEELRDDLQDEEMV